jgi:glycosyltransferase involved in cell wall biosynthesis
MNAKGADQPLISVIMPTYNHGRFIGEAIRSVLDQTYKNFELIVVDNHSEDNTEERVRSFGDARIKYFKFRNNDVIASSRNFGIKRSSGRYIAFLDSDDMWLPFKLRSQVDCMEKNSDAGLMYTKCLVMKDGKTYRTAPCMNLYNGCVFGRMILMTNVPILTAMIRKEVVEKIGLFDEDVNLVAVEDWDYWIRLSKEYRVVSSAEPSAIYREHGKNISKGLRQQLNRCLYLSKKLVRSGTISLSQCVFLFVPGFVVAFIAKLARRNLQVSR